MPPPIPLHVINPKSRAEPPLLKNTDIQTLSTTIEGEIRTDHHNRMLYATDAGAYQVEPLAVVIPENQNDIISTLSFARQHNLTILPRGAGTSLAGQCVNRSIILDTSVYCNDFININKDNRTCRVMPGIILDELNRLVSKHTADQLFFGPDVASSNRATIGGMIGNNSAGAHSILFGRTINHIKSIKATLANGQILDFHEGAAQTDPRIHTITRQLADIVLPIRKTIRRAYPTITRTEGGYDLARLLDQLESSSPGSFDRVNLAQLLVGSEGTLAITLEAELYLVPKPHAKGLAILAFASLDKAVAAVSIALSTNPAAVELLDEQILKLAQSNLQTNKLVDLMPRLSNDQPPQAVLFIEYFGDDIAVINNYFTLLSQSLPNTPTAFHRTKHDMESIWQLRKAAEPLAHAIPGLRKPVGFVEDTAVNPSLLPDFVRRFRKIIEAHGSTASYYAHASVGCLHIRPLLDLRNPVDRTAMQNIAEEITDLICELHGSLSAEHGFGRARGALLSRRFPKEIIDAYTKIKNIFDPHHILNPGNLINPQPITRNLRVQPHDTPIHIAPFNSYYDYESEGGLSHAFERCNGAAVCRKEKTGLMCPSYMATRDERHSPRGRANALRLAMTGQFTNNNTIATTNKPTFNDPQTLRTLDWCLSCKGCKSECPSNVDVAKYKAEYLAQSYQNGNYIPISSRLLSRINLINRLGSAFAPLSNTLLNFPPLRAALYRALGISPRRTLPTFAQSFHHWFNHYTQTVPDNAPAVILYADCFTNYNEPDIARAAVRVLNQFGYRVLAPRIPCCGRPMISQGLLTQAQHQVATAAAALHTIIHDNNIQAIIVCEPSCLSALRDDWLTLKTTTPTNHLNHIANIARLPEEFLEDNWQTHPQHPQPHIHDENKLSNNNRPQNILLHGHCHQRSLWGIESTISLLHKITSPAHSQITATQGTCCGMAGAFGYQKKNFDLSMKIGELELFPAVRNLNNSDIILATGTSCRHQIFDATAKHAQHPIQYIAHRLT